MSYIINKWALIRRGELSVTPDNIEIHPDFLHSLSHEDFEAAFRQVGDIFYQIITDISKEPEPFGMPLFDESTTRYGATEAHESRYAAWRPMQLLYAIFAHGHLDGNCFRVDLEEYKKAISGHKGARKVKNTPLLLLTLENYGFMISGLTNGKITSKTMEFTIEYPDNSNVLKVLELVSQKVASVDSVFFPNNYSSSMENMFNKWSYRLLAEGLNTNSYSDTYYAIHDKTRTAEEREFISKFHHAMEEMGYCHADGSWNEGPGVLYYDKETTMQRRGPYQFRILDWMGDLRLMLRIRSAEKCLALYDGKDMPEEILEMFRYSDPGCGSHADGSCKKGVGYIFEGKPRWHCGCCSAPFWLHPKAESIPQYIELVEVGERK